MKEKLCVFCVNLLWEYDEGDDCPTCGYGPESDMKCSKGFWEEDMLEGNLKSYREKILRAKKCKYYELVNAEK